MLTPAVRSIFILLSQLVLDRDVVLDEVKVLLYLSHCSGPLPVMAERTGFEPVARLSRACGGVIIHCFKPLSPLSGLHPWHHSRADLQATQLRCFLRLTF